LGQAMVNVAIPKTEEHESRIFENHDIRGMVDSPQHPRAEQTS
jgi:hypothetical protein